MPTEKKTVTEFQTKPIVRKALRELGKRGSEQLESAEMREAIQLVFKLEEGGVIDRSQTVAIIDLLRIYQDVALHWRRFSIVQKTQDEERKVTLMREASQEVIETCAGLQYDQEMAIDQAETDVLLEKIGLLNILLAEFGNEHEHNSGNTTSATAAAPSEQPKLSEEEEHLLELKNQSETLLALTQDLEAQLQNLQFDPRVALPAVSPPASYAEHLESLLAVAKNNATVLATVSEMKAVTLLQKRLKPTIEQAEKVLDKAHARILELKTNEFIASQANFTQQVTQHTTALQAIPITPAVSPQPLLTACDQFLATLESNARAFDTSGAVWDRLVTYNLNGLIQERAITEEKHVQFELRDLVSKIDSIIDVQGQPQPAVSTWTYAQACQEKVDLETEENTARPILQSNLVNYPVAQDYIDRVSHRLPIAKTVLTDRIDDAGVSEYTARPEITSLNTRIANIVSINIDEDLLIQGATPKVGGRNITLRNLTNTSQPFGMKEQLAQAESVAQNSGLLDQGVFVYSLSQKAKSERDKTITNLANSKRKINEAINITKGWRELDLAAKPIQSFYEGGYLEFPSSWREGEWRREDPEVLAKALWLFVLHKVIFPETTADKVFMNMDILSKQVMLGGDSFSTISLFESFASLDIQLSSVPLSSGRARRGGEFKALSDKLAIDCSEISKIYARGNGVYTTELNPDAMLSFYANKDNRMDATNLDRIFHIGDGYGQRIVAGCEIFEDKHSVADRLQWSLQAYFAMNDPTEEPLVYIPAEEQTGHDAVFAWYKIQNPLSIYPTANRPASEILLKRYVVRQLVGSDDPPPWVSNPLQRRVNTPGQMDETVHEFAIRQKKYIAECVDNLLRDLSSRYESSGASKVQEVEKYMSPTEQRAHDRNWGYVPEQLSINIGEYALEPCKAEGGKLKSGQTREIKKNGVLTQIPVVDVGAGPASIFVATRWGMVGPYRSKLTKETQAEGTPGPRITLWSFGEFLPTMFDYYHTIPQGEHQGGSLKELLLISNNASQAARLPFGRALSNAERAGSEEDLPWFEAVRLAKLHYDRAVTPTKAIPINWQQIRSFSAGSEATSMTFNPGVATNTLAPIAREITYLMQRDYGHSFAKETMTSAGVGTEVCEWSSKQDHDDFIRLEADYVAQFKNGVKAPLRPSWAQNTPRWDKLWRQVCDFNYLKKPDARFEVWDILKPGSSDGKIVRIASRFRSVVHIPIDEKQMNSFERAVCLTMPDGSFNDHWSVVKKLFFGNLMIGSIKAGGSEQITMKDIDVILQLMSEDYWRFKNLNAVAKAFRRFRGVPEPVYEGLGILTEHEVLEMLRVAGVSRDFIRTMQDVVETLPKFQIKK